MEIETLHFATAASFIAALRRSDPYWLRDELWDVPWIFRGESSDEWKLMPTAWRPSAKEHRIYWATNQVDWDSRVQDLISNPQYAGFSLSYEVGRELIVQNAFEFHAVRAFYDLVDELGLSLPGGPMRDTPSHDPLESPSYSVPHPVFGLARHHKVPVRLLDWTHNPLIAAYFAASATRADTTGNLVVWALNQHEAFKNPMDCAAFTVPRSQIGFLHAQQGLFTYIPSANLYFTMKGRWPTLEDVVPRSAFRRLTLPKTECPKLLRLLWAERISKAHLMPTLDNVKEAIDDMWELWYELGTDRATRTESSSD